MRLLRLALAATLTLACAAPAAAQRYTAKQNGEVIDLADTTAQMNVSVIWSMSDAWRIQVKGHDLVRTSPTLEDFMARPGLNGVPLLAPFANRLDETAFYANGKKYNFDLELGNVRGPIPSTGFVNGTKAWQIVEFKADGKSAWVTCRLDFYKIPAFMKQFPFAHTITMTYRVSDGVLEVNTRLDNLSNEPMPVVIGFHPIFELPDGNRDDWSVSLDAKTHWIEIPQRLPTGETQPIENFFGSDRTAIQLKKYALIDDVFTDLVRDANGRATMRLTYNGKELRRDPRAEVQDRAGVVHAAARGRCGRRWRWRRTRRWRRVAAAARASRATGALRSVPRRSGPGRESRASGRSARRRRARADGQGLHRLRTDGRDHQRVEPRAEGRLQGSADDPARRFVGRELLDYDERLLGLMRPGDSGQFSQRPSDAVPARAARADGYSRRSQRHEDHKEFMLLVAGACSGCSRGARTALCGLRVLRDTPSARDARAVTSRAIRLCY